MKGLNLFIRVISGILISFSEKLMRIPLITLMNRFSPNQTKRGLFKIKESIFSFILKSPLLVWFDPLTQRVTGI